MPLVNSILLFLTLCAILWYLIEIRTIRGRVNYQNDLLIRPFIILNHKYEGHKDITIFINNIGNGPALNISIEPITVTCDFKNKTVSFSQIDFLAPKASANAKTETDMGECLILGSDKKYPFKVIYSDLNGKKYFTSGFIGEKTIRFDKTDEVAED